MKRKRLLVVLKDKNDINEPIRYEVKSAFLNLKKENIDVVFGSFEELELFLDPKESKAFLSPKNELKDFDLIYFRNINCSPELLFHCVMGLYPNLPMLQNVKTGTRVNKLYQYCRFANQGLLFPRTFFANTPKLEEKIDQIENFINYPIIVKDIAGAHGKNIFLAKNRQELIKFIKLSRKLDLKVVFQEFIPNDWDMRLIILGDEIKLAVKRQRINKKEWRNNTSLGADRKILNLDKIDPEWEKLAVKAVNSIFYTIGGVDIVQNSDNKKLYLLEVNLSPQFKPGTTEAIMDFIKKKMS